MLEAIQAIAALCAISGGSTEASEIQMYQSFCQAHYVKCVETKSLNECVIEYQQEYFNIQPTNLEESDD